MDRDTAAEVIQRIFTEIIDATRLESYDELFHADFVDHGMAGDSHGKEAFLAYLAQFQAALSNMRHDVSDVLLIDDETAVWQVHFTGNFTGEFMGVKGDGRALELTTVNAGRLRDGKAIEHWGPGPDGGADLMAQFGISMEA